MGSLQLLLQETLYCTQYTIQCHLHTKCSTIHCIDLMSWSIGVVTTLTMFLMRYGKCLVVINATLSKPVKLLSSEGRRRLSGVEAFWWSTKMGMLRSNTLGLGRAHFWSQESLPNNKTHPHHPENCRASKAKHRGQSTECRAKVAYHWLQWTLCQSLIDGS